MAEELRNGGAVGLESSRPPAPAPPTTGCGAWVYHFDGAPCVADDNTLELLGLQRAEWSRRRALTLERIHPDDRDAVRAAIENSRSRGSAGPIEFRVCLPNGAYRWLEGLGTVERDDRGRPIALRGLVHDVTARRITEERLRGQDALVRAICDHSPEAIYVKDSESRWLFANEPAVAMLGLDNAAAVIGRDNAALVRDAAQAAAMRDSDSRVMQSQKAETTEEVFRHEGEARCMIATKAPLRDESGSVVGLVGIAHDVTERRATEEALRRADRIKDEFIAMLAHELRNPLAPIRNASEVLALRCAHDPLAAAPLAMLRRQTEQLSRLLDDLLDVSRIAQGRVTLRREVLDISLVIQQAVETVTPQLRSKRHVLRVERDTARLCVRGDRARLAQTLTNVLHNAVKYTPENGEIVVTARRDGDDVEIRVRDNGIGIGPELLPRVFELFVQSERAAVRAEGGLGIGLSVVKHLVELHGGRVSIWSGGLGRGTTLTLRLPCTRQIALSERRPTQSGEKRHVLVVDDSVDSADSLAMLLKLQGHDVDVVYSGSAAVDAAQRNPPDVVFLDIGLPGIDGYEVARRLRDDDRCRRVRLVALTGYGQADDRERSRAAGFDAHLIKPADIGALTALLASD